MSDTTPTIPQQESKPADPPPKRFVLRKLDEWRETWAKSRTQAEQKKREKEITKIERSMYREAWWLMSQEYNATPSKLRPDEKQFYEKSLELAMRTIVIPSVGAGLFVGSLVHGAIWAAFPKQLTYITKKRIRNFTGLFFACWSAWYGKNLWSDMNFKTLLDMKGSPFSDTFYIKLTEKCPQSTLIAYYPRFIPDEFEPVDVKPTRVLTLIQNSEESNRRKNIKAPMEGEINYAKIIKENMKQDMEASPDVFWSRYGTKQQKEEEERKRQEEAKSGYKFDPEIEIVDETLWDDSPEFEGKFSTNNITDKYHKQLLSMKPQKVIQYEKEQEKILQEILEEEERLKKEAQEIEPLLPEDKQYRKRQKAILEYLEKKKRGQFGNNEEEK